MGNIQAAGYAEMVATDMIGLGIALLAHLTSNHFPPLPSSFVTPAKKAIELYNNGDYNATVSLEDTGYSHHVHGKDIPVLECIEIWHLDAFLDCEE